MPTDTPPPPMLPDTPPPPMQQALAALTTGARRQLFVVVTELLKALNDLPAKWPAVQGQLLILTDELRRLLGPAGVPVTLHVLLCYPSGLCDPETSSWVTEQARQARAALELLRKAMSGPPPNDKPATVNQRMLSHLHDDPSSSSWTQRKWARHLGCVCSAVAKTPAWRTILKLRAQDRDDFTSQRPDRRQKRRHHG